MQAVAAVRQLCPKNLILADVKSPDVGGLEAKICFDAGADWMTVMGAAPEETIKLALAAFPSEGAKRIVLFSDGNENRGNAREAAQQARQEGADIYVVPLKEEHKGEVLVEQVIAPPEVGQQAAISGHMATLSYRTQKKVVWDAAANKHHFI